MKRLVASAICGAAWVSFAASVETPKLRMEFDDATGALDGIWEKGRETPVLDARGRGLWAVELEGGQALTDEVPLFAPETPMVPSTRVNRTGDAAN